MPYLSVAVDVRDVVFRQMFLAPIISTIGSQKKKVESFRKLRNGTTIGQKFKSVIFCAPIATPSSTGRWIRRGPKIGP